MAIIYTCKISMFVLPYFTYFDRSKTKEINFEAQDIYTCTSTWTSDTSIFPSFICALHFKVSNKINIHVTASASEEKKKNSVLNWDRKKILNFFIYNIFFFLFVSCIPLSITTAKQQS